MSSTYYEHDRLTLLHGDAADLSMPEDSVDLIVTSPPYFQMRSYRDDGQHYGGQIGDEETPSEFIDALIRCTREWMRVLKPSGSIWINLGDKYSAKSLMSIPWRYAIRCTDELGLLLRAEVIWAKMGGLPESVTDRVRRSHEVLLHFTLQPKYFSAIDEIREEYASAPDPGRDRKSLGGLPGSVWTITTQALRVPEELEVDHFAAFPMELPRRIIKGWSPSGICMTCGEGRRPVAHTELDDTRTPARQNTYLPAVTQANDGSNGRGSSHWGQWTRRVITGYACACSEPTAPTRPAVVLDPFGGTGTTALVASVLGRHGISNDLSNDYLRLAKWRCTDPAERARAMQVDPPTKPPVQVDGQLMFGIEMES